MDQVLIPLKLTAQAFMRACKPYIKYNSEKKRGSVSYSIDYSNKDIYYNYLYCVSDEFTISSLSKQANLSNLFYQGILLSKKTGI